VADDVDPGLEVPLDPGLDVVRSHDLALADRDPNRGCSLLEGLLDAAVTDGHWETLPSWPTT
jgi:hypothetical protein